MRVTHFRRAMLFPLAIALLGSGRAEAEELQSWDKVIPGARRFVVLSDFTNEAVLDRETQLVWERVPAKETFLNWFQAVEMCLEREVGGRRGWRLPSAEELASLMSSTNPNHSGLPTGHPFDVQEFFHWSATSSVADPNQAIFVHFRLGLVGAFDKNEAESQGGGRPWCVRGGRGS